MTFMAPFPLWDILISTAGGIFVSTLFFSARPGLVCALGLNREGGRGMSVYWVHERQVFLLNICRKACCISHRSWFFKIVRAGRCRNIWPVWKFCVLAFGEIYRCWSCADFVQGSRQKLRHKGTVLMSTVIFSCNHESGLLELPICSSARALHHCLLYKTELAPWIQIASESLSKWTDNGHNESFWLQHQATQKSIKEKKTVKGSKGLTKKS